MARSELRAGEGPLARAELSSGVGTIRVTGLTVYPIKSTAGVSLDACDVEPQGLAMDRRWMIVDEYGEFLTGREFPVLTQVRSRATTGGLAVTAPGMESLTIPVPDSTGASRPVRVWNDQCHALASAPRVDEWFTRLLAARCHLVYMDDTGQRPVDLDYARPGDRVSFADGFPLLLISEASLEDLNARLSGPMSMSRFRPNVVVAGCGPFDEDRWRSIRIGEVRLHGVKRCSRCVFTTIDPESGEEHPRGEPLRTLSSYRRTDDGGVMFGRNLIPRGTGTIRLGDVVTIDDHE